MRNKLCGFSEMTILKHNIIMDWNLVKLITKQNISNQPVMRNEIKKS